MNEMTISKNDELVMKLLHFFITEQGYHPIILHGAKDEIWLENMENSYKIVRIVSNYIHNNEQLDFDLFRTKEVVKKIKKKTFAFKMNTLSIFVNLSEYVNIEQSEDKNHLLFNIKNISDIKENNTILEIFPTITKNTHFKEKGAELFMRITDEINKKSEEEAQKAEAVFSNKKPIVTYAIIAINVLVFIMMYIFGNGSEDVATLFKFGANVPYYITHNFEIYRLVTSAFLHIGVIHLAFNLYALYVIGPQLESFLGKLKFIIIYLISAISGNLMSCLFIGDQNISAGSSGAIFGLLGALLYFGYHYRVYLGNVLKSQIIPLIVINLFIGFTIQGIDNSAHIGGLIGGALMLMGLGVKYKSSKFEKVNGLILTSIYILFLVYMGFFR